MNTSVNSYDDAKAFFESVVKNVNIESLTPDRAKKLNDELKIFSDRLKQLGEQLGNNMFHGNLNTIQITQITDIAEMYEGVQSLMHNVTKRVASTVVTIFPTPQPPIPSREAKISQDVKSAAAEQEIVEQPKLLVESRFNIGKVSKNCVKALLQCAPTGSWILSEQGKDLIVSHKFEGDILETTLKNDQTVGVLKDFEENMNITPQLINKTQKNYDCQVQLNLGRGVTSMGLFEKRAKKGGGDSTFAVELKDSKSSEDQLKVLANLTHHSRVYLIGHHDAGSDYLTSQGGEGRQKLTVHDFAELLIEHAPQLFIPSEDGRNLTISIIGCDAGSPKQARPSFAVRLSRELDKRGIAATILARTDVVKTEMGEGGVSTGRKLVGNKRPITGDKIAVSTVKGVTTINLVKYD